MPLLFRTQKRLSDYPYIIEIHKSSFRKWMEEYSVKDFLSGGKIQMEPEKFGDPNWVNSLYYQVYPTSIDIFKKYPLPGYLYLKDDENGKIKVVYG